MVMPFKKISESRIASNCGTELRKVGLNGGMQSKITGSVEILNWIKQSRNYCLEEETKDSLPQA
jgi:hypothetical protein